jgi:hypothetical protein
MSVRHRFKVTKTMTYSDILILNFLQKDTSSSAPPGDTSDKPGDVGSKVNIFITAWYLH